MSESNHDKQMLRSILDAARRTVLHYHGTSYELYSLGQLEATANIAYILTMDEGDSEFEAYCQEMAAEAIKRMAKLTKKSAPPVMAKAI